MSGARKIWVARDENGTLCFFEGEKPAKKSGNRYWDQQRKICYMEIDEYSCKGEFYKENRQETDLFFDNIKWKDDEPVQVVLINRNKGIPNEFEDDEEP